VLVEYAHMGSRFRVNTKIKIDPASSELVFDVKNKIFKLIPNPTYDQESRLVCDNGNTILFDLQSKLQKIIAEQEIKEESFDAGTVQSRLAARNKQNDAIEKIKTVQHLFQEFITHKESKIGRGINSYRSTNQHFLDFTSGKKVLLGDLKKEFLNAFLAYLEKQNLAGSTIFKQFKNLRIFLNWLKANDEDGLLHIPNSYQNFRVKARFADPIGLTVEQFKFFIALNLSSRSELERTRDLFVFGVAMGGLRYGDLVSLAAMLRKYGAGLGTLTFFEAKTGNQHTDVPLNDLAKNIISKYEKFPLVPSNFRMNQNLKTIGRLLNWNVPKIIPTYNAYGQITGKKITELKDLVSTKLMRKTSATIDGLLNIEPMVSMKRSGHKSLSSYMRYRDVNKESFELSNQKWNSVFETKQPSTKQTGLVDQSSKDT